MDNFEKWWMNGGQEIATGIYSEQAETNILPKLAELPPYVPERNTAYDNNLEAEANNIFWDELERLARENDLHLKQIGA